jgi:hypothetical protein
MFEKMVPLSVERHRNKRVRHSTNLKFAAPFHIAYLTSHEFTRAGAVYPIVFVEDKAEGGFRSVALMGLTAGENLFVDRTGRWQASYIPAMIRRYPFALSKQEGSDRYLVCVDEGSTLLDDKEGAPLFDEAGQPTEVVENVKRYLSELQAMDKLTRELATFLVEHDLLVPLNLRVNSASQLRKITGCFIVSEERFNALPDEVIVQMRQRRFLSAVYAHLMSLPQIERLVDLSKRRAAAAPAAKAKPAARRKPRVAAAH